MEKHIILTFILTTTFILSLVCGQTVMVEFFDSKVEVNEGGHFNVRIVKQGIVDEPVLVVVRVPNDSGNDFVGASQVARYAARETGVTSVTFTVNDDLEAETDELFYLRLEPLDPNVLVGAKSMLQVIIRANDDAYGVFSIDEPSPVLVTERSFTTVTKLKVKRDVSAFGSIVVSYMVNSSDPDAVPGQDIMPVTGTVTFQAQQKEAEISLQIRHDQIPEADESFFLTLTSATNNARVIGDMIEIVIQANDAAVRFSNSQYRFEEGPNSKRVSVDITRGLDSEGQRSSLGNINHLVTLRYGFEVNTNGGATEPQDFEGADGALTFQPLETRKSISFLIKDDDVPELEEYFQIRLFNLEGEAELVTPSMATVIINANDNPSGILSFQATSDGERPLQRVNEDTFSSVTFTVHRYEGTFGEVSVQWEITRDLGASAPVTEDVGPSEGTLEFAAGQNEASITLTVVQDNSPEPAEMFHINLVPNSVTGNAEVQGVTVARLLVEDSDDIYGTVEFGPGTDHALFTSISPRVLRLSVTRSGGREQNLLANISVQYEDSYAQREEGDVLVTSMETFVLPQGQDPVLVDFELKDSAFLSIGGEFTARIESIGFQEPPRFGAFNGPNIGFFRPQTTVFVQPAQANGETGFFNVTNQVVEEPEEGVTLVGLLVSREGLSGRAVVRWSVSGTDVTADDVQELSGIVIFETGMSEVLINIGIKADDIPELTESIIVSLNSIEPSDTQRLRPGATSIVIAVLSNDNPGGVIQFSPQMAASFQVEEGGETIPVVVERTGGLLEERSVRYSISPGGEQQFYGATNVLTFSPGMRQATARVVAIPDGIPEVSARFTLTLTPMGNPPSVLGERTSVSITILGSDNPFGVIQFYTDPTIMTTGEGQAGQQLNVTVLVQRDWGTNGRVSVPWSLAPAGQQDLTPPSGTMVFEDGQSEAGIVLLVVNDDIPESDEQFVLQLSAPDGGAQSGFPMVARIDITENDNPVEFTESVVYAREPQNIVLTIERQGRVDKEAHVFYRTLDGSASHLEGDYVQIPTQQLVFAAQERQKTIQVSVLDDDVPEGNETFSVQLLDVGGDLIVTDSSTATVAILANDDAFGVFSFGEPRLQEVEEGSTVFYNIVRSRGNVGSVRVYWELRRAGETGPLTPGEDFQTNSGFTDFSAQENQQPLAISPLADRLPETAESFQLVLTRVEVTSGGSSEGNLVSLSPTNLVARINVLASDDPNGRMAFNAVSRELAVAEDFAPDNEASTRAAFTVERRQGTRNNVQVLWEIFSDKVGGDLPPVVDLLFTGQWPSLMSDVVNKRRPGTRTPVAIFSGAQGQFVTANQENIPPLTNQNDGFSMSAWVQPFPECDGYILAYATADGGNHYLSLKLRATSTTTSLTLRLSSTAQANQEFTVNSPIKVDDGLWHHVVVALGNTTIRFYLDGILLDTPSTPGTAVERGPGQWLVGAAPPGTDLYTGYMQDVRIFMRALEASAVSELYLSAPIEDITPISGTLTYENGVRTQSFTIQSKQDIEEEGREVFSVILLGVSGGAALSLTDSRTTLSVLKSDNANGLFGFESQCNPTRAEDEAVTVTCSLIRDRGDDGTVTVSWLVEQRVGQDLVEAITDFDLTRGAVVFLPGVRRQTFELQLTDETTPELDEVFQISLTSAVSDDGLVGSTETSGASLDPNRQVSVLVIEQNDYPYGLLQFSPIVGQPPELDVMLPPVAEPVPITVSEEGGVVPLVVQRAQGTLGEVRAEWRTKDITALSEGKSPPDYVGAVGNIFMAAGENFAFVNITVRDNSLPETEKTFSVELVNPTGGAELGPGAQALVTIEASDGAFGILQFADASLNVQGNEGGDDGFNIIPLQISRLAGLIGVASVSYEVDETAGDQSSSDIANPSGVLSFQAGQDSATLNLQVRGDTVPELDEIVTVRLVQTVGGQLGDPLKTTATVTVLANDDPYGRFIIAPAFRPGRVDEKDQDVRITVQRLGGTAGSVEVDYVTVDPSETFPFFPGPVTRAGTEDYEPTQGTVSFGPGQASGELILRTLDDDFPEQDESVFVRLTQVRLIQGEQLSPVLNSPRLGMDSMTYGQLIISTNDDANGRLTLSPSSLSVSESDLLVGLYVQRTGGDFGEVSVAFRVVDGEALLKSDFDLLSRVVILGSGESQKRVPLELIDDRLPELAETFRVELVQPVTGGAVLGDQISSLVTIQPSDDPNGLFRFVSQGQTVQELETAYTVDITVFREGGSIGVVTVNWEATLDGEPAVADVSPASGFLYFVSNDPSHQISITILPDRIPEGSEEIRIRLTNATNGGRIDPSTDTYLLTIAPNDSPHGTVELAADTFLVAESHIDGSQVASIVRSGGVYGRLMVFYSTSVLSLLDLLRQSNTNILGVFDEPYEGVPNLDGTELDLSNSNDTEQTCARACLLQSSCASFLYRLVNSVPVCLWYTTVVAPNLLQYDMHAAYYYKNQDKMSDLVVPQARDGEDFSSVTKTWTFIEDGQTTAELPLAILDDSIPELQERFRLKLDEVRVADETLASDNLDAPKLGARTQAIVVIETNDNAFGVFSIVKPLRYESDELGAGVLEVLETDRLAVDLVVERQGGTLGEVSVEWSVSTVNRTAVYGQDFIADGATLIFSVGQTRRTITFTILDDSIPEGDEELTVVLGNPKGGATLSDANSMKVIILASDFYAGRLSFRRTSELVNEGDQITVVVLRSDPGAGTVTADWLITGRSGTQAALGFAETTGALTFLPGELQKEISLQVLVDDTPEVKEEYIMTLQNIVTQGVETSGEAELDPQRGTVLITIAANDEPHGVFQLALTQDAIVFQEDVGIATVRVDRKFGAIGTVRVSYTVMEGSLSPLGTQRSPARAGQDFVAVPSGFIDLRDGETSGNIQVTLVDDSSPEIDEVFILRLTDVALLDSTDQSQPPKLDVSGIETEIIINANDGAQGVIEFAQDSRSVTVTEQGQTISLTVVRGMGTFGRVTVFYYSQPVTESTVPAQDYNMVDAELVFEEGESRQSIVLTILDDADPEPSETFHIILAQPSNGATLGNDTTASITILANDNAGGIITFDSADFIQMREATPNDLSGTKAEILIRRGPGAFGSLSVGYTVTTNDGQFTGDVSAQIGTIDFADRQTTAVLVLETVNDDSPEVEETFTLTLQEPPGNAVLGDITSRTLIIAASDAPYGLMEIFTADSRLSSYSVEEAFRTLEFDIVRSQGTLGEVSVDVMAVPGTATATQDMTSVVLAPISRALGASVVDWHHVTSSVSSAASSTAGSTSFLVMLTSLPSNTQLASMLPADSGVGAGQSVLYKWQGQLTHVRTFTTDGASAATSFISDGITYLVVTNSGREGSRQVTSFLYSLSAQGGLQVIDSFATSGASDATTFLHGNKWFLFIANSLDDNSRSDIASHLYAWDESQSHFGSTPVQLVPTLYARGVASFSVGGKTFVAVANFFDRSSGSYEVSSVIYRMESDLTLVQHQQLATQGAVSVVYTQAGNMQLLAVANNRQDVIRTPQDSFVYRWDALAQTFVFHQTLQTRRALKVTATRTSGGSALLIFANSVGDSEIFVWDVERSQYKSAWTGSSFQALQPVTFQQPNGALDVVAAAHLDRLEAPQLFQLAHVAAGSDFVPRRVTMTFEPGQAVLRTSMVTLTDDTPEDTESFSVSVVSPRGGAEIGPQASVSVEMLSNDDAHGVIEFNEDSLELTVEESVDRDTTVQLNVVRRLGYFGRVTVAWQATGDHGGVGDITPLTGQVTFPNGQSVATITLTVRDDREPEFAEVTYIRLTNIVDDGTTLDTKGARLGSNTVATVTVLANDSPYGVVSWDQTSLTVSEPEGTDKSVAVTITRRQGLERAITVTYVTSVAETLPESSQAKPGEDFVSTQGNVVLAEGISSVRVLIVIKQDSHPEADETFLVNLTSVTFQGQEAGSAAAPSIALNGGVMEITITENDNARGFVELDVNTNNEGRLDVYEELGRDVTIELPIRRRVGFFGSLIVTWQADSVEADIRDYSPASGTVEFADQQREAKILISILDDTIPENMETFDVKLIDVTGDAGLGQTTSVRIAILKNDSPTGLFRFATSMVETREASTPSDSAGQATLVIQRVQGNQGLVNVRWRLNAEAESDFMPPLEGTVQFSQGEVEKAIVLQTRPDDVLEGREEFIVSLVSADNNADISSTGGDSTVVILPDGGASGTISVLPDFRSVVVGEPGQSSPGYPGEVEVQLTRGLGIFGEVVITWSLTPRDLSAFLQVEGSLRFRDLQQTASIVLQTRDDSVPELRRTFTLRLNSASGGAVLSPASGATSVSVTFVASDYPHGLVQFVLPPVVEVSEDQGNVRVTVSRGKGLNGQLEVAYSTESSKASENQDYLPSAGVLTFPAGVDTQTVTVAILQDDLAEGPEDLFVNLTSVVLVDDTNDYSDVSGLSRDMAPAIGPLSTKTIIITKNDNAEGILQFTQATYSVKEESGLATVTVTRQVGSYGSVSVRYSTQMLTATEDQDYVGTEGTLFLADGVSQAELNITLKDDSSMEQQESFRVVLFNVTGGALLSTPSTATINILKSDYPNGRFAFQGPLQVSLPNQETPQRTVLVVERTGGVLGQQEVFWRIMGPNNPNLQLEDTTDLSYLSDQGAEVTTGSFSWADGESGTRQFSLDVKAYTSWEVEKTFIVELYRVVATPQAIGEGEVDQDMAKVAIKIERFGDPNGVVEFTGDATSERQILEPDGESSAMLTFELTRKTGTGVVGTIEIYWEVRPATPGRVDLQQSEGSIVMSQGQRDAQIVLNVLPDDIPELTEQFSLVLVRVEGGATLNPTLRESKFSIRYNDQPHGVFGLQAELQAVQVNSDLSRHVKVTISRLAGTFGRVLASYTISYDLSATGIALDPSSDSVTFEDGENETVALVSIRGSAFLPLDSTFTVRLTSVLYLGAGASGEPEIQSSMSTVQVAVPPLAANTELSFSSDLAFVDEDMKTLTVSLTRAGTYGSLSAQWISGYSPADKPEGVENGEIIPPSGVVQMAHGQEEATLTVQVSAQVNRSEMFLLRLPRSPQTVVSGGARLASTNQIVRADPGGVIQFSTDSVTAVASELDGKLTLTVWRLYGSESGLAVYYETVPGTANSALDFQHVRSGMIAMANQQTVAQFDIQIYQDNIPEQAEGFYVNITGVEKLPTPIEPVQSPRLSSDSSVTLSTVTIAESNDPYGILSLVTTQEEVAEGFTTVQLNIVRSGGDFGQISVRVRTVGGGESWTSQIVPDTSNTGRPPDTIAQALGRRGNQGLATGGEDYNILDTTVEMQAGESKKEVQVTILEDEFPEDAESVLVYLTQPVGGARIATGMNDGGNKGFTEIRIESSDLEQGSIQFEEDSRNVQVNEDVFPHVATLKLARFNHFIGNVTVNWRAKKTLSSTDQEDAALSSQLTVTAGSVICPATQTPCDLLIPIADDTIPEESFAFVVILTSTEPGLQLPPQTNSAEVVILPSDDVRGLIQFTSDSRTVTVGESASQVRLTVRRDKGQQYDIQVAYETEQMSSSVQVSGSTVYPALEGQDFRRQTGTLVFPSAGQDQATTVTIDLTLTPTVESDNPLPKQFYVKLRQPTNGARVDPQADTAIVRLVEDGNVAIWRIISGFDEDGTVDDIEIINIATQLREQAGSPLTTKSLNLIEDFLNGVNEEGERRSLPDNVVTPVVDLYCQLLDSTIEDARRGRGSLGATLEAFSYTMLKDETCISGTSGNNELIRADCGAVRIASGRWPRNQLAGNQFTLQQQNSITVPDPLPGNTAGGQTSECVDFSLLEYKEQTWFHTGSGDDGLMNSAIIGLGLKGRQSGSIQNPVTFTIHTKDRRIAVKGAQCQYFDDAREQWVSPSGVCRVINNLGGEDFVTCECLHMTHYGVAATTRGDNIVGYDAWFYVICFICMTCTLLAVIVHHLFFSRPTFSASIHMHFLMAVFFTHMCFVIDTFLSEDTILPTSSSDDNSDCIAMSLFLHYFFLAQFMWIATQAVNLWKIFVLNDEHTDRHFIVFFIIGWVVPVVLVAIFYAVTFNIYKYHTDLDVQFIYGDVNNNREICFITNEYVALGGILAPALVCLFVLGLMCMKAYQVASQWQMYDDVYRGRSNERELPLLLLIYGTLVLLSVWLALHMIYGYLWMLVLFCIFDIIFGLLNFVLYAVMRNPVFANIFGPSKASYSVSSEVSAYPDHQLSYYTTASSVKGSEANLLNDTWESTTDGGRSRMTVRRALPSQAYINPPIAVISPAGTINSDSPDFDDLIFALKMGSAGIRSVSPSDISGPSGSESMSMHDDDISQLSIVLDHYETKRIDIADTHL